MENWYKFTTLKIKINKDTNNSFLINFKLIHRQYHTENKQSQIIKNEDIECDYDDYLKFNGM